MRRLTPVILAAFLALLPCTEATEVILTGGVALRSWENYRGKSAHDNWWANFVRASTIRMEHIYAQSPNASITWIVYRPAYITRGKEQGKNLVRNIEETAAKFKVRLVWVDTAKDAYKAINKTKAPITSFYYFGHSNAHAWMLDYSNSIIGSSKQWMHEKDLATHINRNLFSPKADCRSYGCYTGQSMTYLWRKAFGIPLWGNTDSTRYQPVGEGRLPEGAGTWVR